MTPQELKNSILQLAIQGKLVEQRAEEGTGRELLEKILAAKNAEGAKGKGEKSHAKSAKSAKVGSCVSRDEIPDDEKPFDIPDSWEWVRLGAIGSWSAGATPLRTQPDYYGGNIPWLKTGDLNDGYVTEIPETITEVALEKTSVRLNPVGSVLMAMYGATIGKLGILKIPATTNQACCACIPCKWIYNEYLFYFLRANRSAFIKMGEGGAQPNISKEKIAKTLFPLPPLAEQERIVAKIEELLPLIDRYEKAWSRLENFNKSFPVDMQKSILQMAIQGKLVEQRSEEGTGRELMEKILAAKNAKDAEKGKGKGRLTRSRGDRGDAPTSAPSASPRDEIPDDEKPFDIPNSWEWVRLGALGILKSGYAFKSTEYTKDGIQVVRISDLDDDVVGFKDAVYYPQKEELSQYLIVDGSFLICMTGSIGKMAWVRDGVLRYLNQRVGMFIPDELCTSAYIWFFLHTSYVIEGWIRAKTSTNGNIKNSDITELLIPLPPLAEQKRIVAKLEELLPLCERLK